MNSPVKNSTPGDANNIGWGELLNRRYLPKLATLAMALWLHSTNSMLTATTMPSAVGEVGGLHLLNWTFALYLVGSIIAGASSSLLVARHGLRGTMLRAALVYLLGCVVCALALSMPVILGGRMLQGLGGGCLVALVYIGQDRFFPNHLVPRVVASLSAVWMVSAFAGPVIGGAFATWGVWRGAYWAFALQALLLIPAIRTLLPASESRSEPSSGENAAGIPAVRLALLAAAILLVSMAGADDDVGRSLAYIVIGVVMLGAFIHRDHHAARDRMLPAAAVNLSGTVGSGIAMTFMICFSFMAFLVYGPLILIRLYDMTPFTAGLVVVLESVSWGISALLFSGISAKREGALIRLGATLFLLHLGLMALAMPSGNLWAVVPAVLLGGGGVGMMWGYIIKRIVGAAEPAEKDRAASMVAITQQTGFALGSATCGVLANGLGLGDAATAEVTRHVAFWLFAGYLPFALVGVLLALRFGSPSAELRSAET